MSFKFQIDDLDTEEFIYLTERRFSWCKNKAEAIYNLISVNDIHSTYLFNESCLMSNILIEKRNNWMKETQDYFNGEHDVGISSASNCLVEKIDDGLIYEFKYDDDKELFLVIWKEC